MCQAYTFKLEYLILRWSKKLFLQQHHITSLETWKITQNHFLASLEFEPSHLPEVKLIKRSNFKKFVII